MRQSIQKYFEFGMVSHTRGIAQPAAWCAPKCTRPNFDYPHEYANRGDSVTRHRAPLARRLRNSFSCASAKVGTD